MMDGTCERCGTEFVDTTTNHSKRFCSDNCRKRVCDDGHRAKCLDCGIPLGARSGWKSRSGHLYERCRPCEITRQNARTGERGDSIERWWAEGLTMAEIGKRLGWSLGHVAVELNRLRTKGFDLPYRRGGKLGWKFDHLKKAA